MSVLHPVTVSTKEIGNGDDRDDVIREFYGKIVQRMEIAPANDQPIQIDATASSLRGSRRRCDSQGKSK